MTSQNKFGHTENPWSIVYSTGDWDSEEGYVKGVLMFGDLPVYEKGTYSQHLHSSIVTQEQTEEAERHIRSAFIDLISMGLNPISVFTSQRSSDPS